MSWFMKRGIPSGSPWHDYKEATKTSNELMFVFRIENFLYFVLREICITYPCDINGRSQLPLKTTVQITSAQLQMTPREVPPELFSSPSQNFRQGVLDEAAEGQRLQPIVFNYPCDRGDTILVSVSGPPSQLTIGCMLSGRKYGEKCL